MQKVNGILCEGHLCTELLAWVERYPDKGDGIVAQSKVWTYGGMASNAAETIARLGGNVTMLTIIGDDHLGANSVTHLRQAGVNIDHVIQRKGAESPFTILMVNPLLQRAGLVLDMDKSLGIRSAEVSADVIAANKVFFTDLSSNKESVALAERAKQVGLTIAFDMQMTETHANIPGLNQNINDIFEISDFFFSDMENFLDWSGEKTIEAGCQKKLARYPEKTLIVTRGADGSVIASSKGLLEIPAFIVPVVDTIGAGDAYHGAFLFTHLILGWGLKQAGLFSSATAALSCLKAGARDGLPGMNQVTSYLREKCRDVDFSDCKSIESIAG